MLPDGEVNSRGGSGGGGGGVLPGDMTEQCGSEAQGGFNEVSLSALRL